MAPLAIREHLLHETETRRSISQPLATRSVAPHAAVFVGIVAVIVFVLLTIGLLGFYLYWRQKRERLEKLQHRAIRHMTIVGPRSSSTYGPFDATGESSFFRASYDDSMRAPTLEQNVPATPPPVYSPGQRKTSPIHMGDSDESLASTIATKRTHASGEDRMVLVNGVYVVALDSDSVRA